MPGKRNRKFRGFKWGIESIGVEIQDFHSCERNRGLWDWFLKPFRDPFRNPFRNPSRNLLGSGGLWSALIWILLQESRAMTPERGGKSAVIKCRSKSDFPWKAISRRQPLKTLAVRCFPITRRTRNLKRTVSLEIISLLGEGGVPKGGFCEGEISIIGVVRAPVPIIYFFLWVLLVESYITSEFFTGIWNKINYCDRCARDPKY